MWEKIFFLPWMHLMNLCLLKKNNFIISVTIDCTVLADRTETKLYLPVSVFFGGISCFETLRPFFWTAMALQAFGKPC